MGTLRAGRACRGGAVWKDLTAELVRRRSDIVVDILLRMCEV
jgi:hypothetical protein